jgi:hypothetical protein
MWTELRSILYVSIASRAEGASRFLLSSPHLPISQQMCLDFGMCYNSLEFPSSHLRHPEHLTLIATNIPLAVRLQIWPQPSPGAVSSAACPISEKIGSAKRQASIVQEWGGIYHEDQRVDMFAVRLLSLAHSLFSLSLLCSVSLSHPCSNKRTIQLHKRNSSFTLWFSNIMRRGLSFKSRYCKKFSLLHIVQTVSGAPQPPIQWVTGALLPAVKR